ncbi:MAG TPA: hypothetical protein VKU42_11790 [Candidatus Angelobacter sp.]|nr:hypothetical protein [Candidatus Angelobacter sp.]
MKRLLPFLLALSASLTWGQPQANHERRYELRPDPNWPLDIELGSGDYQIVASTSDSIAVVYDGSNADAVRKVKVQIDSGHGQNHLKIAGPKSNFHALIEVPRKTDLRVRMSAGGLSIGDVEGNKDIEILAGNLDLNSLHPQDYAQADFSVRVGDMYAPLFKTARSKLSRSFKTAGPGKYRLHAHVGVGDMTLRTTRI